MSAEKKKLIVVLGMHRSGTSAVTRGLQVFGVDLGDNLMPPLEYNEKGFYEDLDLFNFNEEILAFLKKEWSTLSFFDADYVECLRNEGYFARAVELIHKKIEGTSVFGIKDPRVARLLAFWKEVFASCQLDIYYVLAIRHPLSVASSLTKRDNLTLEHGYLLWLSYVYDSLQHSVDCNRIVVDYDLLIQSPTKELTRISQFIAQEIDLNEMTYYEEEFLEQQLRHTVYNVDALQDTVCPAIVREIYTDLLMLALDKAQIEYVGLKDKVTFWASEIERLCFSFTLVDKLVSREKIALQIITEHEIQLAESQSQIMALKYNVTECEKQLDKMLKSNSWVLTKPFRFIYRHLVRLKESVS